MRGLDFLYKGRLFKVFLGNLGCLHVSTAGYAHLICRAECTTEEALPLRAFYHC